MQRPINSRNQTLIVSIAVVLLSLPFGGSMVSVADPVDDVESLADQLTNPPRNGFTRDAATVLCDATEADAMVGRQLDPEQCREEWIAQYDGPGAKYDRGVEVAVSPDGSLVIVTGRSQGDGTGIDYATFAYDPATGEQVWVARYDGPAADADLPRGLAVSPDGSLVFVTGTSQDIEGDGNDWDYATVAYDATTGEQAWVARYDAAGDRDKAYAMAVSPDGSLVFVTGYSDEPESVGSSIDYATVAYDAATGEEAWVARYDGPGGGWDQARSVAVSPDGSLVFVTGVSEGDSGARPRDYATVAYDAATGEQVWVARYDGPDGDWDTANSVAVSPDGSLVFVTGGSMSDWPHSAPFDAVTVAYDTTTGEQAWVARYTGPVEGAVSPDMGSDIAVSPDGSQVFVTGVTGAQDEGLFNALTLAYDAATGEQAWVVVYNGYDGKDMGASVAVSPDGSQVFVAGSSWSSDADFMTFAYNATTGEDEWVARYRGGGLYGSDVAVSPDGSHVFVTGGGSGTGTADDSVTMGYAVTQEDDLLGLLP